MNCYIKIKISILAILLPILIFGQNVPPILNATGNQIYCTGNQTKIVTDFTIVDPDNLGSDFIYIQISTGYVFGQDLLTLTGTNPNINSVWNNTNGTLTLSGISGQSTYIELINAVKNIVYSNNSPNSSGIRKFSISVGQANYLPSNGHYYEFKSNVGITWTNAKNLAQATTYFGLQGYLATLTSEEEAKLAGEQTSGAGWIGGTDEQTEGVWKWASGPEAGTIFWNGAVSGTTPNYAKWNTGEPNDFNQNEDYAHITAIGVGILGSWNDLPNIGDPNSEIYQPKGYIVEYGGMPGDPVLQISTSSTIIIPSITSSSGAKSCGNSILTLQANSNTNTVYWYENSSGGTPIWIGNSFTTPLLSATKSYFVEAFSSLCSSAIRIEIKAEIIQIPEITVNPVFTKCDNENLIIEAQATIGIVNWYDSETSQTSIFLGSQFIVLNINQTTFFYVEAKNQTCTSTRKRVEVKFASSPVATDETLFLCENESKILDAKIPDLVYEWNTNETSQSISIGNAGIYSVKITNANNCSTIKKFTVTNLGLPEIESISINNLTVIIQPKTPRDYEYSIDNFNFQASNVFNLTVGGSYFGYIKNQCGVDKQRFSVIEMPLYFTPNNDGFNDKWIGKEITNYPKFEISIFDRFGKLIVFLNQKNASWDGTFEGKNLPADDYWIIGKTGVDNSVFKGHFSLKR